MDADAIEVRPYFSDSCHGCLPVSDDSAEQQGLPTEESPRIGGPGSVDFTHATLADQGDIGAGGIVEHVVSSRKGSRGPAGGLPALTGPNRRLRFGPTSPRVSTATGSLRHIHSGAPFQGPANTALGSAKPTYLVRPLLLDIRGYFRRVLCGKRPLYTQNRENSLFPTANEPVSLSALSTSLPESSLSSYRDIQQA